MKNHFLSVACCLPPTPEPVDWLVSMSIVCKMHSSAEAFATMLLECFLGMTLRLAFVQPGLQFCLLPAVNTAQSPYVAETMHVSCKQNAALLPSSQHLQYFCSCREVLFVYRSQTKPSALPCVEACASHVV